MQVSHCWKILTRSALAMRINSIQQKGQVDIIANSQGCHITPSKVSFTDDKCLIGDVVKNAFHSNPLNIVFDAKHVFNCITV